MTIHDVARRVATVLGMRVARPLIDALESEAAIDLDFVTGTYLVNGAATDLASNIATTRNDTAYALDAAGIFQQKTTGLHRRTDRGLLGEPSRTNVLKYSTDFGNAAYSVANGATKAVLAGTRGPFTRTQVVATTAVRDSGIQASMWQDLVAGQDYAFTLWCEKGTSNSLLIRLQQNFGSAGHVNIAGRISETGLGATSSPAGVISNVVTRQLSADIWQTSCIFTPAASGSHLLRVGPWTLTNGQDVVILGAQLELGSPTSIIPTTTAVVTRAADTLTAIGPLAAALEAASGALVIELSEVPDGQGDILTGGAGDAVKLLAATNANEVYSQVSGSVLTVAAGSGNLLGANTIVFEWSPQGRRIIWNGGVASTDAVALPAHAAMKFLAGIAGYIRRIRVYPAASLRRAASPSLGFRRLKAAGGAGGFITGIYRSANGTLLARGDVHQAYKLPFGATEWQPLMTAKSMPAPNLMQNGGASELVSAPSDPKRLYMFKTLQNVAGSPTYLYRSDDEGASWTRMTLASVADLGANRSTRLQGRFIAVDPVNRDVVIVGTPAAGVRISTDGGVSFTAIAALGTAADPGFAVAFDPSSAVVGGRTQGILVAKAGAGVYYSSDGGQNFALEAGSPAAWVRMLCDQSGTVWVGNGTANLYKRLAGVWSTVAVGTAPVAIAVHPTDANKVVLLSSSGSISISTDKGATFSGYALFVLRSAPTTPWHLWSNEAVFSSGDIVFDTAGVLYVAAGSGVWKTIPGDPHNQVVTWQECLGGIDILVATSAFSVPGGPLFCMSWDRPIWRVTDPESWPRKHGPDNVNAIVHGWHGDYSWSTPSFAAFLVNTSTPSPVERSCYTEDGGKTYVQYPAKPAAITGNGKYGGAIAVSTPNNQVIATSENGPLYYTLDKGTTWTIATVPGVDNTVGAETGWSASRYTGRRTVCASKAIDNLFFAYNSGSGVSTAGLYRTVDGGVTWTQQYGALPGGASGNAKLKCVPGTAAKLFFSGGTGGASTLTAPSAPGNYLMRSDDGTGAVWTAVPNVCEVWDFSWGKAAPGSPYLTMFIIGFVRNERGAWEFGYWFSTDDCATWRRIATGTDFFAEGSIDNPGTIAGDLNIQGRFYVGFQGSAFKYFGG